jgi:hypothetical protein
MSKRKISYSDILSAVVFIPESPVLIINYMRLGLKVILKIVGKVINMFGSGLKIIMLK